MPETFAVHLGRDDHRSLEAPVSFEAHGPFEVELVNHGPGSHVHLRLDDRLDGTASLDGGNYYVEAESTRTVRVDVAPGDEPVQGELSISTGYGAEEERVAVHLDAPRSRSVEVDDSLAEPRSRPRAGAAGRGVTDRLSPLAVAVLAVLALVLAAAAFLLTQEAVVGIGAFVVVVAVLAAGYLLVGERQVT